MVDDGYQSGIFAEGLVRELRGPRTRFLTGVAPGMFGIFPDRIASEARKKVDEADSSLPYDALSY